MTISATTYWIIFWIVIVLVADGFHLAGKRKRSKALQSAGLLIAVLIFVVNKWIFPNVYVVLQCGSVSKEILIFPKTDASNTRLSLGKHCFLINSSQTPLYVETIVYGNVNTEKSPEKIINESVPAGLAKQFNPVSLDYFFEAQDETIQTKQDGELKYKVSCSK